MSSTTSTKGLSRSFRTRAKRALSEHSVWFLLALIVVLGGLLVERFFSIPNLTNLAETIGILGLLALAESIVLIAGKFDLSIEKNMLFVAMIGAYLVSPGEMALGTELAPVLVVLIMLAIGALVGLVNGLFVAYYGMNDFMTTLATLTILSGLNRFLAPRDAGLRIFPMVASFTYWGRGRLATIPMPLIGLVAVLAVMHFVLKRTTLGRSLYAIGGNPAAAVVAGVKVKQGLCTAYVLSGVVCALAAWMLLGRFNSYNPSMSSNQLFYAVGAAVIGGVSLYGGIGRMPGLFGGIVFIILINNVINLSGLNAYVITLSTGLTIMFAVLVDTLRHRLTQ